MEHPIFSLAAQMRMRYQAVDHDGVTMLGRSETVGPFIRAKISRGLNKPRLK
jgi:hypothetical protein